MSKSEKCTKTVGSAHTCKPLKRLDPNFLWVAIYEFNVGEATVHDIIVWVEDTLVKDGIFSLPGKKALLEDDSIEIVLVNVTECPIERPEKNREISRKRILIENINAKIKVFKIMADKYRNRRKRHFLRLNHICGIINYESQI